jgi:hypothetical protein
MTEILNAVSQYTTEVARLASASTTTEMSYYGAISNLLTEILRHEDLAFDVRVNTSESKGTPDLAFYDSDGGSSVMFGEVKKPDVELPELAKSTANNDQIGRYLEGSRAMLLCNIRSFALLTVSPSWKKQGPVPPEHRHIYTTVEFWPSITPMRRGKAPSQKELTDICQLIVLGVTAHTSISDPQSLAKVLAYQARKAKDALPAQFSKAVQGLLDDFGGALGITFTGEEGEEFFRSSLVQTAFYSIFAGWALWAKSNDPRPFRWRNLSEYLQIPFLAGIFHEFREPTRIKELGLVRYLDMAEGTLLRVDREVFFSRFHVPSLRPGAKDETTTSAILYFYEPFLKAFDPVLRTKLGVWYTPTEIVQYQVRRINELLRSELGCERGFADEDVVVLDPCCGTGAYLIEVLRSMAKELADEGLSEDMMGAKLLEATRTRILGFEILTAPFVVAQLQLYLMLAELGAAPDADHRPAVYLTNALTGWNGSDQLKFHFPEIQHEYDAASGAKKGARIIVVLGNPPYYRYAGAPVHEEADLVEHYKWTLEPPAQRKSLAKSEWKVKKHLLDDLYIRFFRLAEKRIGEKASHGIVCFISNNSFLDGSSHPIMRESLLTNFDVIWIDNLHGDRNASERTPDGASCETVFSTDDGSDGIKVGTAVTTLVKKRSISRRKPELTVIHSRDFWGRADSKRQALLASLECPQDWPQTTFCAKRSEAWKFVPIRAVGDYAQWPKLPDLFPYSSMGVNTNRGREEALVEIRKMALVERMKEYFSADISWEVFAERHPVLATERSRYNPRQVRDAFLANANTFDEEKVLSYLTFPLDWRYIYYETRRKLISECAPNAGKCLEGGTLFLLAVSKPRRPSEALPMISDCLFDLHLHDRGTSGFPVQFWKVHEHGEMFGNVRVANLVPSAWDALASRWGLTGDLLSVTAADVVRGIFWVSLALGHAPSYGKEHRSALSQGWMRLAIPRDDAIFREMMEHGKRVATLLGNRSHPARLLKLLLGDARKQLGKISGGGKSIAESDLHVTRKFHGAARGHWTPRTPQNGETLLDCWGQQTGDLWLNDRVFLSHVPANVWNCELGGYPVLKKWLHARDHSQRPNVPLSLSEVEHLSSIVQRIAALLAIHGDLDRLYASAKADAWTSKDLGI